jgi:hypothetical protein
MYYSKKEVAVKKETDRALKKKQDSILMLYNDLMDANHFALENNDNAQDYYEKYTISELMPKVKDALMEYNTDPEGNKYLDQPIMNGKRYIVNKIKLLNHRWIIADYSNGELWGEVLIKYFVNDDETYRFETIDSYLYPPRKM